MTPLLANIPVGFIANTVAKKMGMTQGIPGVSNTLLLAHVAQHAQDIQAAADHSMPYMKAAAGIAGDRVRQKAGNIRSRLQGRSSDDETGQNNDPAQSERNQSGGADEQGRRRQSINKLGGKAIGRLGPQVGLDNLQKKLSQESDQEDDSGIKERAQVKSRRAFKRYKRQAKEKAKKKIKQKIAKKVASRGAIRLVAGAFGATGVGLIVTYIIWTVQAIAGNLMGSKIIPKLEWWELILWFIIGLLLFALLVLLGGLLITAVKFMIATPGEQAIYLGKALWEYIKDLF